MSVAYFPMRGVWGGFLDPLSFLVSLLGSMFLIFYGTEGFPRFKWEIVIVFSPPKDRPSDSRNGAVFRSLFPSGSPRF